MTRGIQSAVICDKIGLFFYFGKILYRGWILLNDENKNIKFCIQLKFYMISGGIGAIRIFIFCKEYSIFCKELFYRIRNTCNLDWFFSIKGESTSKTTPDLEKK